MKRYVFDLLGTKISLFCTIPPCNAKVILREKEYGRGVVIVSPSERADFDVCAYAPSGEVYREPQIPFSAVFLYFYGLRGLPIGSLDFEYFGKAFDSSEFALCGSRFDCAVTLPRGKAGCVSSRGGIEYPCRDFRGGDLRGVIIEDGRNFSGGFLKDARLSLDGKFARTVFALSLAPRYTVFCDTPVGEGGFDLAVASYVMLRDRGIFECELALLSEDGAKIKFLPAVNGARARFDVRLEEVAEIL